MLSTTVRDVIAQLSSLTEQELEELRTAVGAELMERDLNGRRNGTEKPTEGRGTPGGLSTPAPACEAKIRPNGRGVKPTWEWQTIRVTCGPCRGTRWCKTLLDGVPYSCRQCDGRGTLELTIPVLTCPECGGPPDERVKAGMKCGRCAYGR